MEVNRPAPDPTDAMPRRVCATIQALAHPDRLRIAWLLRDKPLPVGALARALGASPAATSRALAILRAGGVAIAERRGRRVAYRLADAAAERFVAALAQAFALDPRAD